MMFDESIEEERQKDIKKEQQSYTKLEVLGQGSMGKAYLVKSNRDQQLYVMKRINIGYLSEEQKEAAKKEAQLHSIVSHPNIITFKQIYHTTKDKLCIIMEYAEGGDLDLFVKNREGKLIPEETVLQLFSQICLGVRQIHGKKIIHRDLKGENIFLTAGNKVKIGDFGISKVADQTIQASKSFAGTPYYLSPEMVEGKKYSNKSDIWSLGVILYKLCTLKHPFEAQNLPLLAMKIIRGSFPPVVGPYSRELKSLILSLLQVNQTKRPTVNQILTKPIITKFTGQAIKPVTKPNLKKAFSEQPNHKKQKIQKVIVKQDDKIKDKQKRQKAIEKREQLRKQMKEQLRQKRKQIVKDTETSKKQITGIKNNKSVPHLEEKIEVPSEKIPKKVQPKPWKMNKQTSLKKNEAQIQIFLPSDKPKKVEAEPPSQVVPPQNDFKVEIFVSKKPESSEIIQESKNEDDNNDYSEEEEYSQKYEEEESENNINAMLSQVNGAQKAVLDLPDNFNYPQIKLLEDSTLFDNDNEETKNIAKKQAISKEDEESLRFIHSSENLEQCRQILEEGLGEQKFIQAYNILNQHLAESSQKKLQGIALDDYTFNREVIRQKLNFLQDQEFSRYVVLMYTLIIMQDEEMKQNLSTDQIE